jgi:pimeloyl-ACP methyl ester carboxylesterase
MTEHTCVCNGVNIFYRKIGDGKPLVFLHGNGEDGRIFSVAAERFARDGFCVYLVDTRGHGKSGKAPLGYQNFADDVRAFIDELRLSRPALYGFSDGGITGLLLAVQNPGLLLRLAVSGVNLNPRALSRSFRFATRFLHFFTRDEKLRLMLKEPDIRTDELNRITEPVLVLAGSHDIVTRAHTESIAAAIPNAECRILKGETHASYVADNGKLYAQLSGFFGADGESS